MSIDQIFSLSIINTGAVNIELKDIQLKINNRDEIQSFCYRDISIALGLFISLNS